MKRALERRDMQTFHSKPLEEREHLEAVYWDGILKLK
jgi:hypothetical protein